MINRPSSPETPSYTRQSARAHVARQFLSNWARRGRLPRRTRKEEQGGCSWQPIKETGMVTLQRLKTLHSKLIAIPEDSDSTDPDKSNHEGSKDCTSIYAGRRRYRDTRKGTDPLLCSQLV